MTREKLQQANDLLQEIENMKEAIEELQEVPIEKLKGIAIGNSAYVQGVINIPENIKETIRVTLVTKFEFELKRLERLFKDL